MDGALAAAALVFAGLSAAGCSRQFEGGGDLRAQRVVLKREVVGLREAVARLERGESLIPAGDVAVAIDDKLLRDLIAAQLPFELDVKGFHASLTEAEVQFRGSPLVKLRGSGFLKERPAISAAVNAIGALEEIKVDPATGMLGARISIDHLGIEKAAGLESVLSGAALDELARALRLADRDQLPPIQIPVKVQQSVELPAVSSGPVKIAGASMPLEVGVSGAFAGQGRLWIGVSVKPGELAKTPSPKKPGADAKPPAARAPVDEAARFAPAASGPRGRRCSSRRRPSCSYPASSAARTARRPSRSGRRSPRSRRSATFCARGSTS